MTRCRVTEDLNAHDLNQRDATHDEVCAQKMWALQRAAELMMSEDHVIDLVANDEYLTTLLCDLTTAYAIEDEDIIMQRATTLCEAISNKLYAYELSKIE